MKIKHTYTATGAVKLLAIALISLLFIAVSCGTTKDASATTPDHRKLNEKEALELLLSKDSLPFWFFTAKIGVEFTSTEQSNSFNVTVKMKTDSAFSGTMSIATLIGGTYLVNQDSIYFTNKQKKCFVKENFSTLSEMFGTEIEYDFFQSLILGLPVGMDPGGKYKHKTTKEHYIIISDKKKKDPRVKDDKEDKEHKDDKENKDNDDKDNNREDHDRGGPEERIIIQYYINQETWHLDKITIQVPSDGVDIEISYLNRQLYDNFYLPEQTSIKIVHPEDSISIHLDYGNVKLNERKEIDINIPESYEECKTKDIE